MDSRDDEVRDQEVHDLGEIRFEGSQIAVGTVGHDDQTASGRVIGQRVRIADGYDLVGIAVHEHDRSVYVPDPIPGSDRIETASDQ